MANFILDQFFLRPILPVTNFFFIPYASFSKAENFCCNNFGPCVKPTFKQSPKLYLLHALEQGPNGPGYMVDNRIFEQSDFYYHSFIYNLLMVMNMLMESFKSNIAYDSSLSGAYQEF